mgnify:CR=1 FL=1
MDGVDVLQVLKDHMEGAAVARGRDDLIVAVVDGGGAIHLDGGDALEGQTLALGIVEDKLVDLVGVVIVGHGALELEVDDVADVVVGGVLPASGGAGGVISVLNLLFKLRYVSLGGDSHVVYHLDNVEGVGIFLAFQTAIYVLDEVVAAGDGEGIAVVDGAELVAIQIDVLLDDRQLFGVAAGSASQFSDDLRGNGLAGGAGAVLAPLDVGQDALIVVTGEDLIDLIGVAIVGGGDGVGFARCKRRP